MKREKHSDQQIELLVSWDAKNMEQVKKTLPVTTNQIKIGLPWVTGLFKPWGPRGFHAFHGTRMSRLQLHPTR